MAEKDSLVGLGLSSRGPGFKPGHHTLLIASVVTAAQFPCVLICKNGFDEDSPSLQGTGLSQSRLHKASRAQGQAKSVVSDFLAM